MCLSVCLYVADYYENVNQAIYRDFLALKIEEKIYLIVYTLESPRVKIKKQKEVTLYSPFYHVYLTT